MPKCYTRIWWIHFLLRDSYSSENAPQLGSRTCSISRPLPHFNPKQSEVSECQREVRLFWPSLNARWVGLAELERSGQRHDVWNAQLFQLAAGKTFWYYIVNVSSLWPEDRVRSERWHVKSPHIYVCGSGKVKLQPGTWLPHVLGVISSYFFKCSTENQRQKHYVFFSSSLHMHNVMHPAMW